jgi:endonuclease YncB( thermonuclease family)
VRFAYLLIPTAMLFGNSAAALEQQVHGTARAIDGDTLDFSGVRVRLFGIDAPEAKQDCQRNNQTWNCGAEATKILAELIEGKTIKCKGTDTDVYGRLVATCYRDGLDLGLTMIESGLAVTLTNSPEQYAVAENLRKTHKIGIWSANFQTPSGWRAANPTRTPPPVKVVQSQKTFTPERVYRNQFGCAIKGNRNRKGQWIYHLPGKPYYEQTRPEELFCTESQAQQAGYRRSKA